MYAASTASRVAYSTYIYTQVPVDKFQIVTAYTKAALLVGRCLAGILGQILITTGVCDYSTLNYISLGFVSCSTVVACFLPSVSHSLYFHRGKGKKGSHAKELVALQVSKGLKTQESDEAQCSITLVENFPSPDSHAQINKTSVHRLLWKDFTTAFSDTYTLKWSFWWAFATCGFFQVVNYIQPLWEGLASSEPKSELVYNGGVEAIHALLGN